MGCESSSPQQETASRCNAQHALPATKGLSCNAATSAVRISFRFAGVTTGGEAAPTNSNTRPMVHAVVSRTCELASFVAASRNGSAWDATGANLSPSGPSRMLPNANVAASRARHSVWLEMLAVMNGITASTTGSRTHVATSPRHVPPAIATFQASSPSSTWSSSCLVSVSRSMGTSWPSACSTNLWYTGGFEPPSSSSSWIATSSSHTALQNSIACNATASSSSLVAFVVRLKMAVMYGASLS
mmetsp:Transcript_14913/g.63931  ORF Transcript_14913/g.63931 Transcript_14913/m.63931 type:complete len:244 (+) Transcript_14913:1458-2189(+)